MLNASLIYVQLAFLATVRVQEMAIGAGIGLAAVGIYRTAWRTVELIGRGAIQPFTQVAVQTLARVKDDPAELRRAYRWMISRASALSRSEEHTSELQSLMRISYAVLCLNKKKHTKDVNI